MSNKPPIPLGSQFLVYQTEDGKLTVRRRVELYNLDVIISVGYRVKGTQSCCSGGI